MSCFSTRCVAIPGYTLLAAFSPDGRFLAVSGIQLGKMDQEQSFLQVHDAQTLEVVQTAPASNFPLTSLVWSPDSTQLATAGPAGTIDVWDRASGTISRTYYGHSPELASLPSACNPVRREILALCWPTHNQIVSVGQDACMCQWHPHSGNTTRRTVIDGDLSNHPSFSPSGACLVVFTHSLYEQRASNLDALSTEGDLLPNEGLQGDFRGGVSLFDIHTVQTVAVLPGTEKCSCGVWAPEAELLALGADEEIQIWDLQRPRKPHLVQVVPRQLFRGPSTKHSCFPLAWHPDGARLAYCATVTHSSLSSSSDFRFPVRALIEILDAHSGNTLYSAPIAGVSCLAWSPDGKQLVVGRRRECEVITGPFPLCAGNTSADVSAAPSPVE